MMKTAKEDNKMKTVAIAGLLDSRSMEYSYIKELIEGLDLNAFSIHVGLLKPSFTPDISSEDIIKAAGSDIESIAAKNDARVASDIMLIGLRKLLPALYREGKFDGIIAFGGTGVTTIVTSAMQALPIGVPKLMVSTVASGNTEPYVGISDIIMVPSVVEVAGLNSLSTKILTNAAFAVAGMVKFENKKVLKKKPLIAVTMFGTTSPSVDFARKYLEARGYEVLIFHTTGVGGRSMENLISGGYIEGVIDLTTIEWSNQIVGGVMSAGRYRLEAAGLTGIPQVVSVGALDMVNFGPADAVPLGFSGRYLYQYNQTVTLMRTSVAENIKIGRKIAEKLNMAKGPTVLMLPLNGISMFDKPGQIFYGVAENAALFNELRANINRQVVEIQELNMHINDQAFAEAAAEKLIGLMGAKGIH
jgi:uncharacterized protein (UPF0261 family)